MAVALSLTLSALWRARSPTKLVAMLEGTRPPK